MEVYCGATLEPLYLGTQILFICHWAYVHNKEANLINSQ